MSIPTLAEIKNKHRPIKNVNLAHRENLSKIDKLAVFVTAKVGTMGFFFIILTWTILWLSWNILSPEELRFDPYPAFVFWLFISNMIQILLMPLLLVGQNLQGRHSEARAEADFEIDMQAKEEVETIILHLERQDELLATIQKHLENK